MDKRFCLISLSSLICWSLCSAVFSLQAQQKTQSFFRVSVDASGLQPELQARVAGLAEEAQSYLNASFAAEDPPPALPAGGAEIQLKCKAIEADQLTVDLWVLLKRPVFASEMVAVLCQQQYRQERFRYQPSSPMRPGSPYPETEAEYFFSCLRAFLLALWEQSFWAEGAKIPLQKAASYAASAPGASSSTGTTDGLYSSIRALSQTAYSEHSLAALWYFYHRECLDQIVEQASAASLALEEVVRALYASFTKTAPSLGELHWQRIWSSAKAAELIRLCQGRAKELELLKACFPTAFMRLHP